jgi:kynureninase
MQIDREVNGHFEIITPTEPKERACQLSVFLHGEGRQLFDYLMKEGVIVDWREPNVIRLAPVPLYCLALKTCTSLARYLRLQYLSHKK